MNNFKKIGIRIVVVITLLVGFNFIYQYLFYENDVKKEASIIEILPEPSDSAQILYFAESSNFTSHKFDVDKRSISEIIAAYYPAKKLIDVDKGALHSGIYKVLLGNIPEENQIETIIVTLNLRSFGADWIYSKLETSLQKSIVLIQPNLPLLNRIQLSFKGYDVKTNKERHEQVIRHWKRDKLNFPYDFKYTNALDWEKGKNNEGFWFDNGDKDYAKTALACHYIKSYGFSIDENKNPRIKDFDDIVAYCQARKWNVVFNLMAENTEKANELVGSDLIFLMRRNRDFLVDRYSKKGVIVVDNLEDVATQYYIDQNWTTEHYTEEGRLKIAATVADSLKLLYANEYQQISEPEIIQASYFTNSCENNTTWQNINTLSNEQAFDGMYSSKINMDQPYSITFERALKFIPDSTKNKVLVNFKALRTIEHSAVKVVLELQGDYVQPKWLVQNLNESEPNCWVEHVYQFDLTETDLRSYNLIKIYCSNKLEASTFIDSWELIFE
ncbi:MAG: hypothetical protein PF541_16030 [Prolixibacteraceae bacterium]|nr:hypothetical protein [Prolixibacteraceae bacterium]